MKVAIIGAGITGVTTAYELAAEGHEVTVFERLASVASEASFANAGIVAPDYATPWAAFGVPAKVLRQLFTARAAVRLSGLPDRALAAWIWRWWRASAGSRYAANRTCFHRLARYSQLRLKTLAADLRLEYEQRDGMLVLLRNERDVALARDGLKLLAEMGARFRLVDAQRCHEIEPGLNRETPLRAGIHLPDAGVGNCRQFASRLKTEAARLDAVFRLQEEVLSISAGPRPLLQHRRAADAQTAVMESRFDAVVVCAALGTPRLLAPLGLRVPLAPVYGLSVTAPLRLIEGHPEIGPQSALIDERYNVAISRLGTRVRVAGGTELSGHPVRAHPRALATLYQVLHDWYPGVAHMAQSQHWKGARPMLPDGSPVVGSSGIDGVWLNIGHGSNGWALACGSARVIADLIARRAPDIDLEELGVDRLR